MNLDLPRWKGKGSWVFFKRFLHALFGIVGKVHVRFHIARFLVLEIVFHPVLHIDDLLMVFSTHDAKSDVHEHGDTPPPGQLIIAMIR